MEYTFLVTRNTNPKPKPTDCKSLGFGKYFTDHMLIMDYDEGKGWHDGRIIPYGPICMDPGSTTLHYGQMMFEGLKAYRNPEGGLNLFRPDMNAKRLNRTNERMCIPPMDEDLFLAAVKAIVKVDEDWTPTDPGTSLYIRPFIISPEVSFSVLPAKKYWFIIILCAVGAYYEGNESKLHGSRILVEEEYIRAAIGGTGFAKCAGNYACGMIASYKAHEFGCEEVLWLDAKERRYVEEVGTSNAFFKIGDKIVTPMLTGSILPGVTRDSVIKLLRKWGYEVEERRIELDEIFEAIQNGTLKEAWATGTACVISPIGVLNYKGVDHVINNEVVGDVSQKLYDTLYGMQIGKLPDIMGDWIVKI
jgi:branched-chain amino acid aminotransferase